MHVNFVPFVILWGVLAVVVLALIVWRKGVTWHNDNTLRLLDAGAVSQQAVVTHKLDLIDKWGKTLTAITVIFGLLIAVAYAYQTWIQAYSSL